MDCIVPILDSKQGVCVCVALEKLGLYAMALVAYCRTITSVFEVYSYSYFCVLYIELTLTLADTYLILQKDDIKANMERRKLHLQKLLADSQDKVERHLAGEQGVFQGEEVRLGT